MLELREKIIVNNTPVYIQPYTELRAQMLQRVEGEITEFVKKNAKVRFSDMDISVKADIWMKKAKILWDPAPKQDAEGNVLELNDNHWDKKDQFFTSEFFKDPSFEYPLLRKTQDFFLSQGFFL